MTKKLLEMDDALGIVLGTTARLQSERVELDHALERVLADDAASERPVPPFDSSAMDGFAVRAGDASGAAQLRVVGESRAGHPAERTVGAGEAIAISTGAVLPAGADAVVPIEDCNSRDGHVEVRAPVVVGANVRHAGDDIRAGQVVLPAGTVLGPEELGVLASLGLAHADCTRRPRVAVITTGDELVEPGEPLAPGAIYNSNGRTVPALVRRAGGQPVLAATVCDDRDTTRMAIGTALGEADVVVICGGVSVGAHDHVKPVLAELDVDERFWGIALRPGKPTWFGTRGDTLVFGLPGNPVSAMVTFTLLVAPALRALSGAAVLRHTTTAVLASDYEKAPGRAHAVRCRLELRDDGWHAHPTGDRSSHVLTSMVGADALAMIPSASGTVRAGQRVTIALLDRWFRCAQA